MSDVRKIRFILNPFSGIGRKRIIPSLLEEFLDKELWTHDIRYTDGPGHAVELSNEAVSKDYECIVAIGGDGSINEVARPLIGTDVKLGIIPAGSGNGIARSLGIPLNTRKAIDRINHGDFMRIDTGRMDNHPFIGISGIGFDAHIGSRFHKKRMRGKMGYGYVMMREFNRFEPFDYSMDNGATKKRAFVLAFANTSQYGNNAVIAPQADFFDGLFEVIAVSRMKKRSIPAMFLRLFNRSIDKSKIVDSMQLQRSVVWHNANMGHVDGEPLEITERTVFELVPKSLNVIV